MINLHFDLGMLAVESVLSRIVELEMSRLPSDLRLKDLLRDVVRLTCEQCVEALGGFVQHQGVGVVLDCSHCDFDGLVRWQVREERRGGPVDVENGRSSTRTNVPVMVRDVKRSLRLRLRHIAHREVPIGAVPRVVPLVNGWRGTLSTLTEEEIGYFLNHRRLLLPSDSRRERVILLLSRNVFRPPKVLVRC